MKTCESCNRPLEEGEERFCPACKANSAYKRNKWIEGIGIVIIAVAGFVVRSLMGGKGSGKS